MGAGSLSPSRSRLLHLLTLLCSGPCHAAKSIRVRVRVRAVPLLLLLGIPQAPAPALPVPRPVPEPRYLLFWRTPETVPALVRTIGEKGDGRTRLLGFGLPCATFPLESHVPSLIHQAFAAARQNGVAVMLQFDFHIAWQNRPDLWNWFDPKKPGYNPQNRMNVEWFGWDGPPAKARYLNWGVAERMVPPVCFTSRRIRAEWTRLIRNVIAPPLKEELAALKREGTELLFAGVLVGSEPTFDDYAHTDPDTEKLVAQDGAPRGLLGYRALMDRGYSRSRPPTDIHQALGQIIQETVAFWCRRFAEAGLPRDKVYPHVPAGAAVEVSNSPVWAAFNAWCRPGWSTYPVGPLEKGLGPIYAELKHRGNPPWGGVEANAGVPGSAVDWETYLGWHYNHGAVLVGVNTGATGAELPAIMEKSAFGPGALAAYRRFLSGQPLREKPISPDSPQVLLQRKMQPVQEGIRKWHAEGRDPSPIGQYLEEKLPPLLRANRINEALAVLDEALARLKQR